MERGRKLNRCRLDSLGYRAVILNRINIYHKQSPLNNPINQASAGIYGALSHKLFARKLAGGKEVLPDTAEKNLSTTRINYF